MNYEKDLMNYWDEYSILKAAKEKGVEEGKIEVVKNLLATNKFSISEIANFANVNESFVQKVKKEIK